MANLTNEKAEFAIAIFRHFSPFFAIAPPPLFMLCYVMLFFFFFFKERLGLKLTHKRITTKVVLPASKGKGAIQGEVKMCKEGESYDDKLLKSPKVRRYRVRNQRK